jgi:membrane associated rhomboid family serine protease
MPRNRGHSDPWFRVGPIDVTTTVLITALCVVSLFVWAANKEFLLHLYVLPSDFPGEGSVFGGQVWRLITWPIANDLEGNNALWNVISIALFWYFGREVENRIGRVKFAWMFALIAVLGGLVAQLLDNVPLGAIRTVELALFVVFVAENPRARFFFGIPAWAIGLVFVGIEVLQDIGDERPELLIILIVTLATAVLSARAFGMLIEQQWIPKLGRGGSRRRVSSRSGRSASSGPVVVDGPWPTTPPAYRPMQDQAEVDQILDKIALVGMEGLTSDEKRRLNEASKRLRKGGN